MPNQRGFSKEHRPKRRSRCSFSLSWRICGLCMMLFLESKLREAIKTTILEQNPLNYKVDGGLCLNLPPPPSPFSQRQKMVSLQGRGAHFQLFFFGGGGGGLAPRARVCRGVWGYPPPEHFEIEMSSSQKGGGAIAIPLSSSVISIRRSFSFNLSVKFVPRKLHED